MKYILAADDEATNRFIIEESLMDSYEVKCVSNGLECLKSIQERMPDLLLLDLAMPKMDGLEVCRQLRANEKTCNLPIIMLTGFAAKEHIAKGYQVGANDYLTKPFDPELLRSAIQKYIA